MKRAFFVTGTDTDIGKTTVAAGLLHAARLDRLIKGVADGDVWDEFAQLILRVVRP